MNPANSTAEAGIVDRRRRSRTAFALLKAVLALALLYLGTYRAWPVILEHMGSTQTSAVLTLDQPSVALPARTVLVVPEGIRIRVACSANVEPQTIFCTTTARGDTALQIYEVVERAFGWRMMPAVRDMRVGTAFSDSALLNEAMAWLIPSILLAWLAAWPSRADLQRSVRALKAAPWLPLAPLLLFAIVFVWVLAQGGGLRLGTLGAFAVIPVLLGPLQEELLYRGAAYRYMSHLRAPVLAQATLPTAAFVLLHAPRFGSHPSLALWATLAGLGLFWVRHRYGSLSLCIALHGLYNLLAIQLFLPR